MAINSELLRKRVERLEGLPTLPSIATSLLEMTRNPRTSATEVGELISRDQALTSRVLKLVNSAYYGFPKQISTVNHAVVILGFSRVKNIVLAASVFGLEHQGQPGNLDAPAFWRHSLGAAVAGRSLARELKRGDAEEAFVCGLLHDIGKLILAQVSTQEYQQCLERAARDHRLIRDIELEVFGLDHSEVGSWLAERWKLPPTVQAAIRYHHAPGDTRKSRDAAAVTHLGDILARSLQIGSGGDPSIPRLDAGVVQDAEITPERLEGLVAAVLEGLRQARDFFDMIRE